ncbi:NAD(P)-dependent alcohol dehydrogenase [Streptomyces sp. NPDC046805]|uniref:NAD(P)-dependent alcohol dehydrogenase n=1 Tax=Streptomyces sp. NPDC046805 TaxID=3155134 RepID=UPI0033D899F2
MRITAAVVEETGGPFVLGDIELAEPRPDEVLVKVSAAGLCHTDLGAAADHYPLKMPAVLGHEGAGVVERVGSNVTKVAPGDHVVLTFNSCGSCGNCRSAKPTYCHNGSALNVIGTRADGSTAYTRDTGAPLSGHFFSQSSFATYSVASERNVVKVSHHVPLDLVGPLGCGIQTGAGAVLNTLCARPGQSLAVFGAGSVGLSSIMAARLSGCGVIVAVDLMPERRELALELGATHVLDGARDDLAEELRRITGEGLDYAIDYTSNGQVVRTAVAALKPLGTCLLGGAAAPGTPIELDMGLIHTGRTVRGMLEGDSVPDLFIPELIEHYRAGRFPFDRLITHFAFEQINEAVKATQSGATVKAVLTMADS